MKSLLRLFRAVEVTDHKIRSKAHVDILKLTIKRGFVFSPSVIANYSYDSLISLIEDVNVTLTPEQLNNSFHKSWGKVRDADVEQLVFEQTLHYFTTYGLEMFDTYDLETVFIPYEKLNIPEITDDIPLTVINGYTKAEIKDKISNLLRSGIALHEDTIKDVVEVAKYVGVDVNNIKNKEVMVALADHLNLVPENPVEFLRYVIFKTTDSTLLIKNAATIEGIKDSTNNKEIYNIFETYKKEYGLNRLAEIFLRFKPLFLAFKSNDLLKPVINKIRKLAIKNHKPMPVDYLNNVTAVIKKGFILDKSKLRYELSKVNTFRKIRLAYALNYRTEHVDSILYKIRNGKGYAKPFYFENKLEAYNVLKTVMKSITEDIKKNVKGKTIKIPDNILYALPATEKQFIGVFPSGSYVIVPKDIIVGIHWDDVLNQRIDLDLSLIDTKETKYGWDAYYRDDDRNILFSGDMTAPDKELGATELFYVKKQIKREAIMVVNYYNYQEDIDVPFDIIVAGEKADIFKANYTINPNNIITTANSKMTKVQKVIGLLVTTSNDSRFYFAGVDLGNSITSSDKEYVTQTRNYLCNFYKNSINLNNVLEMAGAVIVDTDDCDINLSPSVLEKDTIINLLM